MAIWQHQAELKAVFVADCPPIGIHISFRNIRNILFLSLCLSRWWHGPVRQEIKISRFSPRIPAPCIRLVRSRLTAVIKTRIFFLFFSFPLSRPTLDRAPRTTIFPRFCFSTLLSKNSRTILCSFSYRLIRPVLLRECSPSAVLRRETGFPSSLLSVRIRGRNKFFAKFLSFPPRSHWL